MKNTFHSNVLWLLMTYVVLIAGLPASVALSSVVVMPDSDGTSWYAKRERTHASRIRELLGGDYRFRRAYRMSFDEYNELTQLLMPYLSQRPNTRKQRKGAKNGLIPGPLKISATIRYLAGGSIDDIAPVHGVGPSSLYAFINSVLVAINQCPSLEVSFPASHDKQQQIADGFKAISEVAFDICVGAIDGILVWTEKPSEAECKAFGNLQSGSFFCGRKHKFGFNMQAICDSKGRFLEFWIKHPASASDYIAFVTSKFYVDKLSAPGFIKPGLALFGDNAYVSDATMATPFKGVASGVKDDYNFYQSQCRIRIEMAFGMLTRRWGIMRKPMPSGLGIQKQIAIIKACVRLHNFCMGKEDEAAPPTLTRDEVSILSTGGGLRYGQNSRPESLVDGGEHFDDMDESLRELQNCSNDSARQYLKNKVRALGARRHK